MLANSIDPARAGPAAQSHRKHEIPLPEARLLIICAFVIGNATANCDRRTRQQPEIFSLALLLIRAPINHANHRLSSAPISLPAWQQLTKRG